MPGFGLFRLGLMTFPQRWEAGRLTVRFLCLPKGDPEDPLMPGLPSFATANLVFEANVIAGLDRLPRAADATGLGALALDEPPVNKTALFAELTNQFNIVPAAVPVGGARTFRKPVTESYRALAGNRQLNLSSDKDFECALHEAQGSQPPVPKVLSDEVTWGRLMALLLRQPKLATALGLMGQATFEPADASLFANGGWLWIGLHASSDYAAAGPALTGQFAARIPPLNGPRPLYAAVLFPVDGAGTADDVIGEAERYDRGFARMVHGAQTVDRGDGIRLAWDDEQIVTWLTRQVDATKEWPMGTAGYRVDVRTPDSDWNSLVRIASVNDLMLGPNVLGPFEGEAVVEVVPAQISPARAGEFWMPAYFTTWRGSSLALTDPDLARLHENPALANPESAPYLLNREKTFVPVDDRLVPLLYGNSYEFRVRLADLTRGGPEAGDDTPAAADATAAIQFQRRTRPAVVNIVHRPSAAEPFLTLARPRIGYPDALFTGAVTFADLEADFGVDRQREVSVPDPDVVRVEIVVEVKALEGDVSPYLVLYRTEREFAADEITLDVQPEDHPTLDTFSAAQPGGGPLAVPAARDLRLTLTGLGREDEGYFASAESRRGIPVSLELRAPAQVEEPLFAPVDTPLQSFFFQPPPSDGSVASPPQRLAQELDLDASGLTIAARRGARTVLACSASLRHKPSPEGGSITIASTAEVVQRWIQVLRFSLARDWTWDGLAETGIEVRRTVTRGNPPVSVTELAGTIELPRVLASAASLDDDVRSPVRQLTQLLFFDAVDPKPAPGEFPAEITVSYEIAPAYKGGLPAPDPSEESILLPVTTPPSQVPKLVSAGIALSDYVPAGDYSSTNQRNRRLWLEFEKPPDDPEDEYFVRVLANGPDPMLTDETVREIVEPPLPVDPEWMRHIVPAQPRDENGLRAMQRLDRKSNDGARYLLVPLPEGMTETSSDLLGMFTYEIRLGHTESRWCTAQGRFGPPLRVAGVQHPAPPLVCYAARAQHAIRVRAPFATPVLNGRNVRPMFPKTGMWALLYARVRQVDGASWRNLLLARTQLFPPYPVLGNVVPESDGRLLFGEGTFPLPEIADIVRRLGLPEDVPLTALAVELFNDRSTGPFYEDPLGTHLGFTRMLRISPLVPVPDAC